jgi:hypothetical protein
MAMVVVVARVVARALAIHGGGGQEGGQLVFQW